MTEVVKVYTPIKRVPTMIGKAQNGQKLPFGPYTLPQVVGGIVVILLTSVAAMTLPMNPAITFVIGLIITIATVFGLSLLPYSGVRLISRALWFGRLVFFRKPVSASGFPVTAESTRHLAFVDETVVIIFPSDPQPQHRQRRPLERPHIFENLAERAVTPGDAAGPALAGGVH
ncbi:hypothetical protein [Nocardia veterana]|uniref:hypothetical protein n=1 Tax=Nocardia veterana TaxID=132249 RepID=UPI000308EDA8|nr:hypothetical protein [Nocardia veterana]